MFKVNPIEKVKRYFFARRVCKRMGCEFKPWNRSWASFMSREYAIGGGKYPSLIQVNLESDTFYESLAHELGHSMDHEICEMESSLERTEKVSGIETDIKYCDGRNVASTLRREIIASVGARRLLKVWGKLETDSLDILVRFFGTYVSCPGRGDQVADLVSHGERQIKDLHFN